MRLAVALAALVPAVAACTLTPDPPSDNPPNPLGTGDRIAHIQDPSSATHSQAVANPTNGVKVDVSSVVVTWIDTFDETKDGKSRGTVYIQDVGSQAPYAGISLYSPNYVPASLRPLAGDVLDVVGPYEELPNIGSAHFGGTPDGKIAYTLPQLSKPVGTFRYEFRTPDPAVIQLSDVDQNNYLKGRQWEGMLVTVEDVTVGAGTPDSSGLRVSYAMGAGTAPATATAAAITNELYDLGASDYPAGTHFKSVTGIVTWFFSYHIAPRSPDDLKQ